MAWRSRRAEVTLAPDVSTMDPRSEPDGVCAWTETSNAVTEMKATKVFIAKRIAFCAPGGTIYSNNGEKSKSRFNNTGQTVRLRSSRPGASKTVVSLPTQSKTGKQRLQDRSRPGRCLEEARRHLNLTTVSASGPTDGFSVELRAACREARHRWPQYCAARDRASASREWSC